MRGGVSGGCLVTRAGPKRSAAQPALVATARVVMARVVMARVAMARVATLLERVVQATTVG